MSRLERLIHEIHRRSLWQVLSVYLISSWIALQVADTVTAALGLPDWVPQVALVLLIVLLPVVLATAFVQEGVGGATEPAPPEQRDEVKQRPEFLESEPRGAHRRLFTWRNAIAAALSMLILLTVSAGGYMGLRAAGIGPFGTLVSKGLLDERDVIVLADFENLTSDTLIARTITEAFRIDIAQSPIISVADPVYVAGVLRRMERGPNTPLDFALAREVALREGLRAVIAGEVASLGSGYVLSARLVSAESGAELASFRETASDVDELLPAIDRLAKRLRERIGESLKSIRVNEPLAHVTTSSLAALQKYSQAVRAIGSEGDSDKGMALLEEALALDSTFAMAWRKLGAEAGVRGETARSMEAQRKAFQYRDRLTDRERYLTIATYHSAVSGERDKSITALRTLLDTYPDDPWALVRLGRDYTYQRDYERAAMLHLRAIEIAPYSLYGYYNALNAQVALGDFAAADSTLAAFAENLDGVPAEIMARGMVAAARGDLESARTAVLELQNAWGASSTMRWLTTSSLVMIARTRGRLAEAERHSIEAMTIAEGRGRGSDCLSGALDLALQDLWYRARTEAATTQLEAALERYPLASLATVERPYVELASFYVLAERPDRARALLADYEAAWPPDMRRADEPALHRARGDLALAEGRIDDAIREYRLGDEGPCELCMGFQLGRAYDMAGQPDSAIANYERYVTGHSTWAIYAHSYQLAPAYERLGALYEQRGDTAKAIYYYSKLVELWKDADPELQPRVEAARRVMEALSPDT